MIGWTLETLVASTLLMLAVLALRGPVAPPGMTTSGDART